MFKKIIILFLFSIVLTGCSKKTNQTTIEFTSWGSQSEIAILKPILVEFEKENPDIKINFMHVPQNYFQKLHLLFASNLAPDVLFINNLYLPIYANAGVLEPIKLPSKDIFYKKALTALSYNDVLYAIPRDISTLVIYYNKNLFDDYDVNYPDKSWSFIDFLSIAQRFVQDTNQDGKIDIFGFGFEEDLFYCLPWMMSEGGGILSDDGEEIIFDSPESQKGLNYYANLRRKFHVSPTKSEIASETIAQMFLQEKIAMQLSGRWLVPKYRKDANFNWDVINFPQGDKGSIVPLDASGWAISKASKHKTEARKLIDFLSSKRNIIKLTKSGLIVPARIDVAEGEFLQDELLPENEKVFLEVIKTSKPTPICVKYNEILDSLQQRAQYLFN